MFVWFGIAFLKTKRKAWTRMHSFLNRLNQAVCTRDSAIGYLPHKQDAGLERDVDNRSRATFTLVWEESLTKQHVSRQDYRRQGGNPRKKMEAT